MQISTETEVTKIRLIFFDKDIATLKQILEGAKGARRTQSSLSLEMITRIEDVLHGGKMP